MAAVVDEVQRARQPAENPNEWDAFARANGGHLLQSRKWGEFKSRHGWSVELIVVGDGEIQDGAQVLFKQGGPFSIAYVPRGPIIPASASSSASKLISRIDEVCRARRALHIILEPNAPIAPDHEVSFLQFQKGPAHFQPARTVKVPLLDDAELLAQMHQKTRYSVRLAQRRGVVVNREAPGAEAADLFYRLLQETSERNEFGIHSR